MARLVGKVAIVTGGGGGIGAATVKSLSDSGASVAVVDLDEAKAADVAAAVGAAGGDAIALGGDLSVEAAAAAAVQATVDRFGRLDILHNNAALTASDFLSRDTTVTEMAVEVWERSLAVNLNTQMLMCKHAIPAMVRTGGGSIINMSSGAAMSADRTRVAYAVAKAGVNTLTIYVAASHGKHGIRANTIVPGLILTDAVKAHLTEDMLTDLSKATLTPYVGQPADVADLVVFLASDESRYITGQLIRIDGGMSVHVKL
jgi:NAD(P)-dependent dehydrogenase (short-subunit alcohol dehydrogenase family)